MGPQSDPFDGCRVVTVRGELDVTTVSAFARDLEHARHGTGRPFLVVDLSGVTFMDGSVLEPLCAAWNDCRGRGGWVRVVRTGRALNPVFRAMGLLERFPPYAHVQGAWRDVPADRAVADRPT